MGGPTSTLFPSGLANSMTWPLAKHVRFGSAGEGGTVAEVSLSYYVKMKDLVGTDFYTGGDDSFMSGSSGITGVLPYDGSTGYTSETGTIPDIRVYWQFMFWSTNAVNSGLVEGDLTVTVENFCELSQPCSDYAAGVPAGPPGFLHALKPIHTVPDRPGKEPDEPLFSVLKISDGVITQESIMADVNPDPVDPHNYPEAVYPDLSRLPEPEEYVTVRVPKNSLKGKTSEA